MVEAVGTTVPLFIFVGTNNFINPAPLQQPHQTPELNWLAFLKDIFFLPSCPKFIRFRCACWFFSSSSSALPLNDSLLLELLYDKYAGGGRAGVDSDAVSLSVSWLSAAKKLRVSWYGVVASSKGSSRPNLARRI